jgi:ADP-heptose:LPS heptosyltransferase
MTIRVMRTIDRFVGIPLCWMTGLWISLFRPRRTMRSPHNVKTILVTKFFGLGSVLLSTPFLSALHRCYPAAQIIYLTFESNAELLERIPHPARRLTISTSSLWAFLRTTGVAIRKLRTLKIDVVFDLEFFSKYSTLISAISGSPTRVGYALPTRWRRMNLTHQASLDHSAHVTRVFANQLEVIGHRIADLPPVTSVEATTAERVSMQQKLSLGENGTELISVNINAGPTSYERRWEAGRFVEVVRRLHRRNPGVRFFFIGSNNERRYVDSALHGNTDVRGVAMNCAGDLSLGELVALLQRSTLLLTNDSGVMHIASAAGTRVVALFGPESPGTYGPSGTSQTLYKALSCSPCLNMYNAKLFVCPYHAQCMREITIEEVVDAVVLMSSNTFAASV